MSKRDTDNLATMATDLQAENARLRAEVADLQASNASLREQGRRAEVERDAALAKLAEKTADLARERDKLIDACVQETWRRPVRTLANAWDDDPDDEHVFVWRLGSMGDSVGRKDQAIAAVRAAAGLAPANSEAKCPT